MRPLTQATDTAALLAPCKFRGFLLLSRGSPAWAPAAHARLGRQETPGDAPWLPGAPSARSAFSQKMAGALCVPRPMPAPAAPRLLPISLNPCPESPVSQRQTPPPCPCAWPTGGGQGWPARSCPRKCKPQRHSVSTWEGLEHLAPPTARGTIPVFSPNPELGQGGGSHLKAQEEGLGVSLSCSHLSRGDNEGGQRGPSPQNTTGL